MIKNIYKFVLFLILIPGVSLSDWIKLNYQFLGAYNSYYYWNVDIEYLENEIVRFYTFTNYDFPIADIIYSAMYKHEIDCDKGLSRNLSYINYTEYNAKGDIFSSSEEIDNWTKINFDGDGSVMSELTDILC